LLPGESFVDPVFGTTLLNFESVMNGPVFTGEKDTGRNTLEIQKGGNRELEVELTDDNGNTATVPFTFHAGLTDDAGNVINVIEGASLSDDEIFFLNSGDNEHMMQITKLNMVATAANSDVAMKDLISGVTYTFDNHDFSTGYLATIGGQTYNITNTSALEVQVYSSDWSSKISVYPYIELVSGQDTRMAYTDEILVFDDATSLSNKTIVLPTGEVDVTFTDVAALGDCLVTLGASTTGVTTTTWATNRTAGETFIKHGITVGSVDYVLNANETGAADGVCTAVDVWIGLESTQTALAIAQETNPAILFVEDDDKSVGATTKQAILVPMDDVGDYDTVSAPIFVGGDGTAYGTETWDDTEYAGYLTNYGTYVWRHDDTNQDFVGINYGDDMMYAEVSISEGEAANGADVGVVTVTDANVGDAAGKNLVVVGGSAINSVAAELLGAAYSEAAFTSATGVAAGQFLIQSFSRSGKTALLVAGYNAADTEKAVTYLLNSDNAVVTTTGTKYKGTSAVSAELVVA